MSDVAAAAPAAESAPPPQSTADIAASVLAESEASSSEQTVASDEGAAAYSGTEAPQATVEQKPTAAELSAAAKFLLQKGHKTRKDDGRDNWLPMKTVEKFLDEYVEGHRGEWNGARSTLESERDTYRGQLEQLRQEVAGDPEAFLRELAAVDQRYARFLQAAPQAQPQPQATEMPGPDVDLGNGSRTYSVEGIQKLIEWAVDAKMLPKVDERLKPLTEREKAEREKAEGERRYAAMVDQVRSKLETAKTWPHWADYEADILKLMQEDKTKSVTLREAYLEVHAKRQRTSILGELQRAPQAPSVGRAVAERPKAPMSTADIARSVMAELERR